VTALSGALLHPPLGHARSAARARIDFGIVVRRMPLPKNRYPLCEIV
jgi:hypothetical protein